MRIALWILMILGWGSAGLLLSSWVTRCGRPASPSTSTNPTESIIYPCPKLTYKCWVGSLVAVLDGLAWVWVLGMKNVIAGNVYIGTVAMSAVLGATVARILCPK